MIKIKNCLILFLSIIFIPNTIFSQKENYTEILEIEYAIFNGKSVLLDLYMPKKKGIYPAIILVHGGGWVRGTRKGYKPMAISLVEKGYVVANIDYRLAGEAKFPGAVQDVKAAVRWLRTNAEKFNVDSNKISGIGGSAGGHLISMASLTGHSKKFNGRGNYPEVSGELQATVIMGSGVNQVARVKKAKYKYIKNAYMFFGGGYPEKAKNYREGSPINHITKHMKPILIIDGGKDKPGERYTEFIKKLNKKGIINKFKIVPNAKHAEWNKAPFLNQYTILIDQFLKETFNDM
ncbi:hypothetical protein A8C32_09180 [Flavivirga aquatica]|uniref:BD-FAE-like domain-containing protein n=1 Tax=Flavivirga aquatica TaxID=1849968 RepID=A0A1E5SJN6_9FLAO|nr:alpha/beta hydrolase [Flavivirga aquatica]OEJ99328.1 hypothetical protein A8C32_09180 [Flavivirga aquatica]